MTQYGEPRRQTFDKYNLARTYLFFYTTVVYYVMTSDILPPSRYFNKVTIILSILYEYLIKHVQTLYDTCINHSTWFFFSFSCLNSFTTDEVENEKYSQSRKVNVETKAPSSQLFHSKYLNKKKRGGGKKTTHFIMKCHGGSILLNSNT